MKKFWITCLLAAFCFPHSTLGQQWPMFNGPNGNFSSLEKGLNIVESFSEVEYLWESEEDDIGDGKCCYSIQSKLGKGWKYRPSGQSHPIVANNTLFMSYYKATGELATSGNVRNVPSISELEALSSDPANFYGILADDIMLALDIETGKTKWKMVEEAKGLNRVNTKRPRYGAGPAYHDGKVFRVGTMGILYAYNAEDGEKSWEKIIPGGIHQQMIDAKDKAFRKNQIPGGPALFSSLVIAEGLLICPDYMGGILGINPGDGEILWTRENVLNKWNSPTLVHEGNREYLVMHNGNEMNVIDPQNGEVLATVPNLGKQDFSPVASGNIILANGNQSDEVGYWAAFKFENNTLERMWEIPTHTFNLDGDDNAGRKVVIRNDFAYVGVNYKGSNNPIGVWVIDIKKGEVIQVIGQDELDEKPSGWFSTPIFIEDKLIVYTDYRHGASSFSALLFQIKEDGTLTNLDAGQPFTGITTGYQLDLQSPYADGKLFFRREKGTAVAYDLLKSSSATNLLSPRRKNLPQYRVLFEPNTSDIRLVVPRLNGIEPKQLNTLGKQLPEQ